MRLPAAYVIPAEDNPGDQRSQTDYWQDVTEGFSVAVVLDNTGDRRGQKAGFDAVDDVRSSLWKALLGFNPEPENGDIITYAGGQLLDMDRGRLYYQFDFTRQRTVSDDDGRIPEEMDQLDDFSVLAVDVDFISPGSGPDGNIEHHSEINLSE